MGKRVGIIECCINSKGAKEGKSSVAHTKNAGIIAKNLGYEYFVTNEDLFYASQLKFDVLIFTTSSPYADHKDIKNIINNNKNARKILMTNDYKLTAHSELNKYEYEVIANYRQKDDKRKHYFLNLNSLMAQMHLKQTEKKFDCIYWGVCREDRKKSFQKYLKKDIFVSTNQKNKPDFLKIGCNPKFAPQIDWSKSLTNLFRYSLYLEDEWIHNNFHNLANRWYEAGIYNNVTFFDKECQNTIYQSEIAEVYDDFYTVGSYDELQKKIAICNKDFQKHLEIQREWHKIDLDTRYKVLQEIKKIVEG